MYDSRTDHGKHGHNALRANREHGEGDRIEWSTPRARVVATHTATRAAIAEGLADMTGPINRSFAEHGLRTAMRNRWAMLAEWERTLLTQP